MHVERNSAQINTQLDTQHGTIPPILDVFYRPAPPQRTPRPTAKTRVSVGSRRAGLSITVYNAPVPPIVSTEEIAAAPLDELPKLNVSPETAEFHEAFEAWDTTTEASEEMHYGINFCHPPATMKRLDAVRPRLGPFAYDVLSVPNETGLHYNVR